LPSNLVLDEDSSMTFQLFAVRPLIRSAVCLACSVLWVFATVPADCIAQQREVPTLEALKRAFAEKSRQQTAKKLSDIASARSSSSDQRPRLEDFAQSIQPILESSCRDCHGADEQEGNFRVDQLDPDLFGGQDVNWWREVIQVLSNREMPPDEGDLSDENRAHVIDWLSQELLRASIARRKSGEHPSLRRMTRYEFNHALQDLLGLDYEFAADLPPDSISEDGFENSSELLQLSTMQLGYYRLLARKALLKATVRGEQPAPLHWSLTMEEMYRTERAKLDAELAKADSKFAEDLDRLAEERKRITDKYKRRINRAHFAELQTGNSFRVQWNYHQAKYALTPSETQPATPEISQAVRAVLPPEQKMVVELGNRVPDSGNLRVRIRASCAPEQERLLPTLRLEFGFQASNDSHASAPVNRQDIVIRAPSEAPDFYEFEVPLSEVQQRNLVRHTAELGGLPNPSEFLKLHNSGTQGDIWIDYVEVTAPVYAQWPPASHVRLLGSPTSEGAELSDLRLRENLLAFMSRAWRRPVLPSEVDRKLDLFSRIRPRCTDDQEAMVEVLSTILSSPNFLYIGLESSPLAELGHSPAEDLRLATRLALFLWNSIPDEELVHLAEVNQLHSEEVLDAQIERMLKDPRSHRFGEQFVRQWLGLDSLKHLAVDRKDFPRFDRPLREAMQREPVEFFREMLAHNASVLDFLHADYLVINDRLAQHYHTDDPSLGLAGQVIGSHFRRVDLQPQSKRGGLLTQAGVLAMNSDGKDSHPLKRGIWVLERFLNDPPPPPPPAVPEIDLADPAIAQMTLKERLEDHRDDPACYSCHANIDPWGIVFENYDAIGSWRTEAGEKPVDSNTSLPSGTDLQGVEGLKRFLLTHRQDQFVRAFIEKMATFALGRPLTFGDQAEIDRMTSELRSRGDGLQDVVFLTVQSPLFKDEASTRNVAQNSVEEK
jgi:mono/diheme cytochrome c family protein